MVQDEDKLKSREVKLEVTKEDKGDQKAGKEIELENVTCIREKPVSGTDKPTIAEKGGLVEDSDKAVISKERKAAESPAVSPKGDAKHEVVDKDLLQVIFCCKRLSVAIKC